MPETALLSFTGGVRNFIVRTNPNYIAYSYSLRTKTISTYGGKVIQVLGVNYEALQIEIESGSVSVVNGHPGGYAYLRSVVQWFKETSLWQRNNKKPIRFTYPERNYILDVYLKSLNVADDLENVLRPLQMEFEIEDDFTGLLTGDIMESELQYFQDGIGYEVNLYNDPMKQVVNDDPPTTSPGTGGGQGNRDNQG